MARSREPNVQDLENHKSVKVIRIKNLYFDFSFDSYEFWISILQKCNINSSVNFVQGRIYTRLTKTSRLQLCSFCGSQDNKH